MSHLEIIKSKIYQQIVDRNFIEKLNIWRFMDKKIVFTNGCFDILHLGHVDYLSKSADLGNILIVGLNSDSSVSKLKGANRPIINQESRAYIIAALNFVSAVVLFDDDTPYQLIKIVQPNVLVKGSDYKPEQIIGYDIVSAKGGKIETIDFIDGYSTSLIEQKIIKNNISK